MASPQEDNKNTPDFECAAFQSMCAGWTLWSDVLAGQNQIQSKTTVYLPQEPAETDKDYKRRLARSLFFEDSRDCAINLTGMVFRKSPKLADDVPDEIKALAENIDNAGTHLDVFLHRVFEDGFYGHSFIVVDIPTTNEYVQTAADEAGNRSYWCLRQAKDTLNWRTEVINGKTILTQITFRECSKEPDGRFGEKEVVRYRVYLLDGQGNAQWELWEDQFTNRDAFGRFSTTQKRPVLIANGPILTKASQALNRLPIAIHYGEREGFLESRPPLKCIADININFYQKYSDLSNIEHYVCAPTLLITGVDPNDKTEVVMGGNRALLLGQDQDAKFLQVDGKSIEHLENDIKMLQQRLVSKGLDFVNDDKYVPPTATEVILSYTERTSKLAKMVRSMIDCAELALEITAEMEGLDYQKPDGGSISLGVDENALTLNPEQMRVYSEMNERGQLSLHTLWSLLSRADQLPEDFDETDEEARVKQAALDQMELNAKQFDAGDESTP